jgi:hypothetical protein
MPPKGNREKQKQKTQTNGNATKNPPRKHKKQNTKQKGNSFHQKQKIRRSDFLIKLEETQQFSKPTKTRKICCTENVSFPRHRYSTKA